MAAVGPSRPGCLKRTKQQSGAALHAPSREKKLPFREKKRPGPIRKGRKTRLIYSHMKNAHRRRPFAGGGKPTQNQPKNKGADIMPRKTILVLTLFLAACCAMALEASFQKRLVLVPSDTEKAECSPAQASSNPQKLTITGKAEG